MSDARWSASSARVAAAMRGSTEAMTSSAERYACVAAPLRSVPAVAVGTAVGERCEGVGHGVLQAVWRVERVRQSIPPARYGSRPSEPAPGAGQGVRRWREIS